MLGLFQKDDDGEQASELHREATVLKKNGDLTGAIETLRLAKWHLMKSSVGFPNDTWCRLAKVLQQAGYYDEAMAEFDFLMSDLERRMKKQLHFDNPAISFGAPKEKLLAQSLKTHRALVWRERRRIQKLEIKRLRKLSKST